jgi:hypothetical protein
MVFLVTTLSGIWDSMGVVDDDFTRKIPHLVSLKGKKYNLTYIEVQGFLSDVERLGHIIQDYCSKQLR